MTRQYLPPAYLISFLCFNFYHHYFFFYLTYVEINFYLFGVKCLFIPIFITMPFDKLYNFAMIYSKQPQKFIFKVYDNFVVNNFL